MRPVAAILLMLTLSVAAILLMLALSVAAKYWTLVTQPIDVWDYIVFGLQGIAVVFIVLSIWSMHKELAIWRRQNTGGQQWA
jgi:hypothetical protein